MVQSLTENNTTVPNIIVLLAKILVFIAFENTMNAIENTVLLSNV